MELNDELVTSDIIDFMSDELNIINPQSIFCLGEKVFQLFIGSINPNGDDQIIEQDGDIKIRYRDIYINENPVRVYAMPHCGFAGIKDTPIDRQLEYWETAKKDMKELGVVL